MDESTTDRRRRDPDAERDADLTYEVVANGVRHVVTAARAGDGRIAYSLVSVDSEGTVKDRLTGELRVDDLGVVADLVAATFTVLSTGTSKAAQKAYQLSEVRRIHANAYKKWTDAEERVLMDSFRAGTPIRDIAARLGRGRGAIHTRLVRLGEIPVGEPRPPSSSTYEEQQLWGSPRSPAARR